MKMISFVALVACVAGVASKSQSCIEFGLLEGWSRCASCSEVVMCGSGHVASISCGPDQGCFQDLEFASCLPVEKTPCSKCDNGQRRICDPYNDVLVNSCTPGQAPQLLETCPETQSCFNGACVDGRKSSSLNSKIVSEVCEEYAYDDQFVLIKPDCNIGVWCARNESAAVVYECDEGFYFNPVNVTCEPFPINNCVATIQGYAPDRTNCSNGVVCENERQVSSFSCGYYHEYDMDIGTCVSETLPHRCPDLEGCVYEPGRKL